MKNLNLGSYQEQYELNKLQMIKSKKGRIVSLQLLEDLSKKGSFVDININVVFNPEICLQKHLFNQGFLLPYKFSKQLEKAKFTLFLLRENDHISKKDYRISLFQLNESINQEISKILEKNSPNDWELSDVTISKSKK
jgi:hypothetical protein